MVRDCLAALASPTAFFADPPAGRWAVLAPALAVSAAALGGLVAAGAAGPAARGVWSALAVALSLVALLALAFKAALVHLAASYTGLQGDPRLLARALAWTWLPYALLLPAALLLRALDLAGLFVLAVPAAAAWGWRLEVAALRGVYGLTGGRAIALFLVPVLVEVAFVLVALLSLLSLATGLVAGALGIF